MPDVKEVVNGLEMSYKYSNVDENNTLVPQWIVLHALALLKAQDVMVMAGAELTDAELIEEIRKAPITLKPNVDAAPVVRCKDCEFYEEEPYGTLKECYRGCGWTKPSDYCSRGKRRESE